MSQNLVQINKSNALAKGAAPNSWDDDDEQEVVRPKYVQIKNPKSKKSFDNGVFFEDKSGKSWSSIDMVILKILKGRKKQTPYVPGKVRELLCRSNDRKTPVTNDDRFEPLADNCEICPYGRHAWDNFNKKTKEGKPNNPCEETIGFLFLMADNPNQPYIYMVEQFRPRANVVDFDKLIRQISKDAEERTGRRPDVFEYRVTMTTEVQEDGNYLPVFPNVEDLTAEEIETFGGLYQQFVVARRAALDAQGEVADKQAEVDARLSGKDAQEAQEAPAQPVQKPAVKPVYTPPASTRVKGTRPVYTPPVAEKQGPVIDAKIDPPVVTP